MSEAASLARSHTATIISTGRDVLGRRDGGSIWWMIIGYSLLAILIYMLVADKPVVNALSGLTGLGARTVTAWVSPVDPVNSLYTAFGGKIEPGSGGTNPAGAMGVPSPNAQGYVAPFSGGAAGRVDQGQDFTLKAGSPIRAVGSGKITAIVSNWYKGQPGIFEQLSSGPLKGRTVYVAEQITPQVKVGQVVKAGQQIAVYANSGTGLEFGFGTPSGRTLAQATTGYTEGQETAAGKAAKQLLHALGVE